MGEWNTCSITSIFIAFFSNFAFYLSINLLVFQKVSYFVHRKLSSVYCVLQLSYNVWQLFVSQAILSGDYFVH